MKNLALTLATSAVLLSSQNAIAARDYISIVGSSTVYPFSTVVAERLGNTTDFKTPKVEATGSGGGLKLFCDGLGINTPDITNASRRMKASEFEKCQSNGVNDVVEVLIGFDGIVIANAVSAERFPLTLRDLFLALGKDIPNPDGSETLVANPYKKWNEINAALPDAPIEVLGPPPTSGTRDAFAELALEGGCKTFDWLKAMKKTNKPNYKAVCHAMREDGPYIEAGENDNLIVQKLDANPAALGIFGFSFLEQNGDKVQGFSIDGTEPTFETIADKSYPVSRPLYFYIKKGHVDKIPGIGAFIDEFTDEDTWGEEGYLTDKGMIPLSEELRETMGEQARQMIPLTGIE